MACITAVPQTSADVRVLKVIDLWSSVIWIPSHLDCGQASESRIKVLKLRPSRQHLCAQ